MVGRTVLVVDDSASIRNLIYILLAAHSHEAGEDGCENALAPFARGDVGSVLLDLRLPANAEPDAAAGIVKVRHSLFGGVLYISGEVTDPRLMERIQRNCITRARRVSIFYEIWDKVRWLFRVAAPESN